MTEVYIIFFRLSLSLSLFFKFIYFKLKKKNKKEIRRCTARICDGSNGRVVVYLKTLGISLTMLKPFFVCVCVFYCCASALTIRARVIVLMMMEQGVHQRR